MLLVTADESGNPIALGSGFFVENWLIATNYHVIKDASQIYVKIVGRRGRYKITLISPHGENDLVLLKVDDVKGRPLKLGNLARLRVGDDIYVMGNPAGIQTIKSSWSLPALSPTLLRGRTSEDCGQRDFEEMESRVFMRPTLPGVIVSLRNGKTMSRDGWRFLAT